MASLFKRGKIYYARYWLGKKQRMVCLHTKSYPFAKEKLRQIETSLDQDTELPLPSKTSIADVVSVYVKHVQAARTKNTAKSEIYYLRDIFDPICPELQPTQKMKKNPKTGIQSKREECLEARSFESITTALSYIPR